MWECEREAADAIAAQIAAAEQLLASPVAHDGGPPPLTPWASCTASRSLEPGTAPPPRCSGMTRLTRSWLSSTFRLGVSKTFASWSLSYARWRDLLLLTLRRYALDDHVLCDPTGLAPTAAWVRLDNIVLTWIVGTIFVDLHSLLRNLPHARAAWLAIEGQFLGNAEAQALRLDATFRTFV
jgi:hypothetical protein